MPDRIILDLCGGTGAWSKPYADAGYQVELIDLPDDVRLIGLPKRRVYGVLAAPPCTYFCRMRMCQGRPTDEQFRDGLSVVDACLRVIAMTQPQWWVLENPQGYLHRWLGPPRMKFHPWEFGDPWTKNTWLWGDFVLPMKLVTTPTSRKVGNKKRSRALTQSSADGQQFSRSRSKPESDGPSC